MSLGEPVALDDASAPETPPGRLPRGWRRGRHRRRSPWGRAVEWVVIIGVAVLVAVLVRAFIVQAYFIPSGSMEPTLGIGNRILVDRLAYDFGSVQRGDIVVFATSPGDTSDQGIRDLVKRVVALPGDSVSSAPDGQVLVDGKPIPESYIQPAHRTGQGAGPPICSITYTTDHPVCAANGTYRVPSGEYFVMGDNRDDSFDSRYFGPIEGSSIVGQVFVKIWPLDELTVY